VVDGDCQDDSDQRNERDASCDLIPLFGGGGFVDGAGELGEEVGVRAGAALCTIAWFGNPEERIVWILHIEGALSLAHAGLVEIVKNNRQIEIT
jgi:hypothetical protein